MRRAVKPPACASSTARLAAGRSPECIVVGILSRFISAASAFTSMPLRGTEWALSKISRLWWAGVPRLHSRVGLQIERLEHGHDLLHKPGVDMLTRRLSWLARNALPRGRWRYCPSRGVASISPHWRVQPLERHSHFQLAADMSGDRISVTHVKLCSRARGVRLDAVPLFRLLLAFWLPLTRLF